MHAGCQPVIARDLASLQQFRLKTDAVPGVVHEPIDVLGTPRICNAAHAELEVARLGHGLLEACTIENGLERDHVLRLEAWRVGVRDVARDQRLPDRQPFIAPRN